MLAVFDPRCAHSLTDKWGVHTFRTVFLPHPLLFSSFVTLWSVGSVCFYWPAMSVLPNEDTDFTKPPAPNLFLQMFKAKCFSLFPDLRRPYVWELIIWLVWCFGGWGLFANPTHVGSSLMRSRALRSALEFLLIDRDQNKQQHEGKQKTCWIQPVDFTDF